MDNYKVHILKQMLDGINYDEYYLCRLKGDGTKSINLDKEAIKLLIEYYGK